MPRRKPRRYRNNTNALRATQRLDSSLLKALAGRLELATRPAKLGSVYCDPLLSLLLSWSVQTPKILATTLQCAEGSHCSSEVQNDGQTGFWEAVPSQYTSAKRPHRSASTVSVQRESSSTVVDEHWKSVQTGSLRVPMHICGFSQRASRL